MRVARERLIFLALAVLFRAALDAEDKPSTPRADVRLALAVLFIFSRARERRPYDEFWLILRDPYPNEYSEMMLGVRRHQTRRRHQDLRENLRALTEAPHRAPT